MFIKMKYCKHLKSLDKSKNAEIKLKLNRNVSHGAESKKEQQLAPSMLDSMAPLKMH